MDYSLSSSNPRNWQSAVLFSLILSSALILLWPAIHGPFLFDDFPNLQNLREIGDYFTRESIGRYLAAWQGNPGRPLAALSFLIEDHAWPTDPEAFKRNNLLWHLLVGIGIFSLTRKLIRHYPKFADQSTWIGLAVMSIWLVHPMQLSATMLVVQRMTVLSTGLIVCGLLGYLTILHDDRFGNNVRGAMLGIGVLTVFGGLAFLAKENGVLIFAYAMVINLTLAAPAVSRQPPLARKILWAGTAGVTALLVLGLLWQVRDPAAAYSVREFSLQERLLTEPRVLWDYIRLILLPKMTTGIFYDDYEFSRGLLTPWTTLPALLALAGIGGAAFFYRHRFPLIAFGVLWFLAGHLIESSVIPLELVFEHRNYLAMLGPILAVIVGLFAAGGDLRKPLRAALLAWIALTAFIGHSAAKTWGNELTMAEVWAIERPQSTRALQTLAAVYVRLGFYDGAENILRKGIERLPESKELEFQSALLSCLSGNASPQTFEKLIKTSRQANWARIVPNVVQSLRAHLAGGTCNESLTVDRYRRLVDALLHNKNYNEQAEVASYLHYQLARMYLDLDRPAESLDHFREAFLIEPDPEIAINEANVALYLGRPGRALEAIEFAGNADIPAFKRWLYPVEPRLEPLRRAALVQKSRTESNN